MASSSTRRYFTLTKTSPIQRNVPMLIIIIWTILAVTTATRCPENCFSCRGSVANCRGRSLTAPPSAYPSGVRQIDLESNHIRMLGHMSFRRGQTSVEVLKLGENKITILRNDALKSFPRLMSLDLNRNRISRIYPRGLARIPLLRTLSLSNNRLRRVGRIFMRVTNLQNLNLAHNRLSEIQEDDFSSLSNLRILDLRGNSISSIASGAFDETINLRYLFLNNNPIGSAISNLQLSATRLQLLDMSNTEITDFPSAMPATVYELRLGNNQINQINLTSFENITDLRMLTLNQNNLRIIDDGALSHLTQLKEIWLRGNNLGYIPRDIPSNVEELHLGSNRIQEIEEGIFPDDSKLMKFSIENNNIRSLATDAFAGFNDLEEINLQGNQIQVLQARTFVDLDNLKTLKLSNNPIARIEADAFKNLPNLTELSVSYLLPDTTEINGIFFHEMPSLRTLEAMASPGMGHALVAMISDNTFEAPSIEILDLSYNNLQTIPQQILTTFPNLTKTLLDGNPFQCVESLQWLRDWMASSIIEFHSYEEITCSTPLSLRGRQIKTLTDQEFREGGSPDGGDRSVLQVRRRRTHNHGKNKGMQTSNSYTAKGLTQKEKRISKTNLAMREERNRRRKLRIRKRERSGKRRGGKKRRRRGRKNRMKNGKRRGNIKNAKKTNTQR